MAQDRWEWFKQRAHVANFATALAVTTALTAGIFTFASQRLVDETLFADALSSSEQRAIRSRMAEVQQRIVQLSREQEALLRLPSGDPTDKQLQVLAERLQGIEQRQSRIERALLGDPVKALEVPMLRRDLESVREANAQGLAAVRQSVDQVYDLSKWLLGALVVGILSLAISNYFTKKA